MKHFLKEKRPFILLYIALAVWVAVAIYFIFGFNAILDERDAHLPTAIKFCQQNLKELLFGKGYAPFNTPLPYIIMKYLTFGFIPSIQFCRVINFLLAVITMFLIFRIIKKYADNHITLLICLLILFSPYFFKSSVTFYMAMWGLFFASLSLFFYMNMKNNYLSILLTGLSASLSILCQQFYLALPLAFMTGILTDANEKYIDKKLYKLILLILPLILPLLLFMSWGGLTQPKYHGYSLLDYNLTTFINKIPFCNLTAIFVITGFYFLPASVVLSKTVNKWILVLMLMITVTLVEFNTPGFSEHQGFNRITGLVYRLINILNSISPILSKIAGSVFAFSGMIYFYTVLKTEKNKLSDFIKPALVIFFMVFAIDTLISERHLISLMWILFLSLALINLNRKLYYFWVAGMIILGLGYTTHWFLYNI